MISSWPFSPYIRSPKHRLLEREPSDIAPAGWSQCALFALSSAGRSFARIGSSSLWTGFYMWRLQQLKTCSFQELWFTPQYKTYACWAMPSTFPRRARRTALPRLLLLFLPGYRECSCSRSASCPRRTRRRPDICCLLIFATGGNKTKVKTLTVDKSIGFLTISG